MNGYSEDAGRRRIVNWIVVTWCFIISYLVISSSGEFGPYAPLPAGSVALYVTTFIAGFMTGWLIEELGPGLLRVGALVLIPPLIGGAARTVLPTLILEGDFRMAVLLGSWVLQRVLVQILVLALFGVASFLVALAASEISR